MYKSFSHTGSNLSAFREQEFAIRPVPALSLSLVCVSGLPLLSVFYIERLLSAVVLSIHVTIILLLGALISGLGTCDAQVHSHVGSLGPSA
jgi:hypothetical protein